MSAIGFTGDFGSGKTYLAVREALETALSDVQQDGTPCFRRIVSDSPLNGEQVRQFSVEYVPPGVVDQAGVDAWVAAKKTRWPGWRYDDYAVVWRFEKGHAIGEFHLPEPGTWAKPEDLRDVQDCVVIGDEMSLRYDARKGAESPLNVDIRSKWLQQRKDDFDFVLTFQLPRLIDVTFRELCDRGIWHVSSVPSLFRGWRHPERRRPDKVNPRNGRLQVAGDGKTLWDRLLGRITVFSTLMLDLYDFQKPKTQWRPLAEETHWWNEAVAAAYDTEHKIVVSPKLLRAAKSKVIKLTKEGRREEPPEANPPQQMRIE